MPRIDNISPPSPSHKRPFKKKSYRPWNLLDDDFNVEKKQTEHNLDTNQAQTEHNTNTIWTQNSQEEHKANTNQLQMGHKSNTELDTKSEIHQTQTGHKQDTKSNFLTLVGLQKKIILFLYDNCKKIRSKETEPLSLEYLANQLNICLGSVKTTIRRLQVKNLIKRIDFKNGRGGWSRYEVPNELFSEIMQLETEHKINISRIQTKYKTDTEVNTNFLSSSGNYIHKTTTTEDTQNTNQTQPKLPVEWQNIDIEPLSPIGFLKTHLSQIASQNKLSPEIVQDSIYAFAFDLQENNKAKSIKGDPINFFMGILRKVGPYVTPSNYESPQDKSMRLYLENKLAIEQRRAKAEKEAINLAFNDWFSELTDEQKIEFLPEMLRHNTNSEKLGKSKILESSARNHFEAVIWPEIKEKILLNDVIYGEF